MQPLQPEAERCVDLQGAWSLWGCLHQSVACRQIWLAAMLLGLTGVRQGLRKRSHYCQPWLAIVSCEIQKRPECRHRSDAWCQPWLAARLCGHR